MMTSNLAKVLLRAEISSAKINRPGAKKVREVRKKVFIYNQNA